SEIVAKNAEINCEDLGFINGDEELLMQLFQNLIVNAIKYSKPEGKPLIRISDNGIGLANSKNAELFKIFVQEESLINIKGNGVGLATCKEIIDLHDGKIWFESEQNVGTTFYISFDLPLKSEPLNLQNMVYSSN
ncbi:MAG: ATP-binding protein, partial [Flavobacteriaceae bacterium]